MKPRHDTPSRLIDELSDEAASQHAPSIHDLLHHLRREKFRRRRRRSLAWTGSGAAVLALALVLWRYQPSIFPSNLAANGPGSPNVVSTYPPENATRTLTVERVGDEALLELLGNEPVALVRHPDGRRTLLWFD